MSLTQKVSFQFEITAKLLKMSPLSFYQMVIHIVLVLLRFFVVVVIASVVETKSINEHLKYSSGHNV